VLRKILVLKGRKPKSVEKNFTVKSFTLCALNQISLGLSNEGDQLGQGIGKVKNS
jgi:hypothetical protein